MELGLAAESTIYLHKDGEAELAATALGRVYVAYGVADWSFLDDEGKPIPVTHDNALRALPWGRGGKEVADRAAELYAPAVLRPLVERARRSSRVTSIDGSTSATRPTAQARRKRSA